MSQQQAAAITTSLLLEGFDSQTLVADVLGADATATTYLLNCPSGTDGNDCGVYNGSMTVGPWASQTLPSGAETTGNYDFSMSMDTFQFSLHCEMSKTFAQKCTTINIGGNDDGTPTATITASSDLEQYKFEYMPVTITAGQDLLSATHSSSVKATGSATSGTASDTKASASSSASGNASGSASSSAAGSKETGSASSRAIGILAALSVATFTTAALLM